MRYKPDKTRLCPCGCGLLCPTYYDATGRFKGYGRYAIDCPRLKYQKPNGCPQPDRRPIGTRRLAESRKGLFYREIKIDKGGKGWIYEHRHVMATLIGRPLSRREHVHHIDGNTLNNDPSNLALMNPSEHHSHHFTLHRWAKKHDSCVECGTIERKHVSLGLCQRCYARLVAKRLGYWP